jgi:hypothetical protein
MNAKPLISRPNKWIDLTLAGAEFRIGPNQVEGAFHAIPMPLWQAIIGFHRMVTLKWRAESFSYHRWHQPSQTYHSLIPYQRTKARGLHVDFDWTDARNARLLDQYGTVYGEDFFDGACTIHTHVDASAFESGTDAADEAGQPGWHITLGKLFSGKRYDIDFRFRIPTGRKFNELIHTDRAWKLEWQNLFGEHATQDEIFKTPGTRDWEGMLTRIEIV